MCGWWAADSSSLRHPPPIELTLWVMAPTKRHRSAHRDLGRPCQYTRTTHSRYTHQLVWRRLSLQVCTSGLLNPDMNESVGSAPHGPATLSLLPRARGLQQLQRLSAPRGWRVSHRRRRKPQCRPGRPRRSHRPPHCTTSPQVNRHHLRRRLYTSGRHCAGEPNTCSPSDSRSRACRCGSFGCTRYKAGAHQPPRRGSSERMLARARAARARAAWVRAATGRAARARAAKVRAATGRAARARARARPLGQPGPLRRCLERRRTAQQPQPHCAALPHPPCRSCARGHLLGELSSVVVV